MRGKILVAAALAVGLVAPAVGHAKEPIVVECRVDGVTAVGTECVSTFDLAEDDGNHFVSLTYSGGDYRAVTLNAEGQPVSGGSGTNGVVSVTWKDAEDNTVVSYDCRTLAFQADYQPTSAVRINCVETSALKAAVAGEQKLIVVSKELNNAPAGGIRMHGRLNLRPQGDMI